MKSVIGVLEDNGILGDIRQRLGASDEKDTSRDSRIESMNPRMLTAIAFGWELGDDNWGYQIIDMYEALKEDLKDDSDIDPD